MEALLRGTGPVAALIRVETLSMPRLKGYAVPSEESWRRVRVVKL